MYPVVDIVRGIGVDPNDRRPSKSQVIAGGIEIVTYLGTPDKWAPSREMSSGGSGDRGDARDDASAES